MPWRWIGNIAIDTLIELARPRSVKKLRRSLIQMPIFHKYRPAFTKWLSVWCAIFIIIWNLVCSTSWSERRYVVLVLAAKFNLSPYYDFRPEGLAFKHLVWDRYSANRISRNLSARSKLKWIGTTTVEVELRQGVVFHNGDRFTANVFSGTSGD